MKHVLRFLSSSMSSSMSSIKLSSMLVTLFIGLLFTACSGGESGTGLSGGHPQVAVGVITGFGSVFVNGVEYDTSTAEITANDAIATEQDLSIGTVVTVVGSANRSHTAGKATAIVYESDVHGIVKQINPDGSLMVMGQTVELDAETVFESDINTVKTTSDIPIGSVVEASGYRTGDNILHATHLILVSVAYSAGEPLTIKGTISSDFASGRFSLGDLVVAVDNTTEFSNIPNQQLIPGMKIKVKSMREIFNNEFLADKIELSKSKYTNIGDFVEIEGIIMKPDLPAGEFLLNGYTVYFSNQTKFDGGSASNLTEGVKAAVEGVLLSDNQIEAKNISLRNKSKIELTAQVTSVDITADQVNVSGVNVQLTSKTLLKDDDKTTKVKRFSIADLYPGDKVQIKAREGGHANEIVATQFRRQKAQSTDNSFELKGVLDELGSDQIIISGISVDIIRVLSPQLTSQDVGQEIIITGTAPLH